MQHAESRKSDRICFLWIRIKGQTNQVGVSIGVYYWTTSQDEDNNELFFKELREAFK